MPLERLRLDPLVAKLIRHLILMFGFVSHMMGKSRPSVFEFSHPPLETPWDTLNDTVFEENRRIRRADFETMCSKLIIPTDAEGDVITNTR